MALTLSRSKCPASTNSRSWFGVAGDLKIEGHEITTRAAVRAVIPEGYGQRFQATGLYFPGAGCFEVTGRSGDASLTFVTKVTKVRSASN